jgi:hypothetical protein
MVRPIDHPSLFDDIVVPPVWAKSPGILAVQVMISVHSERGKSHEGTFWDQDGIFATVAATTWQKCILAEKM